MSARRLIVFTKPAVPGRVKTRLVGASGNGVAPPRGVDDLSPVHAARLHRAFLQDLVEELSRGRFDLRLAWALEDVGEGVPSLELAAGEVLPGERQRSGDLGVRLEGALADALTEVEAAAVVGSDHPRLSRRRVEEAFDRLEAGEGEGPQVVFGPARDGGYYLVAARREALGRGIFDGIPWSTGQVLEASLQACRRAGLSTALIEPGEDVDTPEDLARLIEQLRDPAESGPSRGTCPGTRELLVEWGWLAP